MNLLNKAREFFGFGPKLRNKAGGYAWISGGVESALLGRVVKTVRFNSDGKWAIEPPQKFMASDMYRAINGALIFPGDNTTCIAIVDDCLTPIPGDLCSDEEVSSLYQSNPTKETA